MNDDICKAILDNSEFIVTTVFNKVTVVACKLPNGYVIVEKAACLSEKEYDQQVGQQMCYELIANKIWELQQFKMLDDVMAIINNMPNAKGYKLDNTKQETNYFDKGTDDELFEALKSAGIYFDDDTKGHKH